ncbi:MAG: DNA polymerase III subunit delta [Lachnospiraceae bacterium]|nr:DNA polymerase III subunit delta [Lachnospiraceae bacterium]
MGVTANSIKNRDFKHTYLLYGEEAYLRRFYKNSLKASLVNEGDNLNFSYFEGKGTDPEEVTSLLTTMPFLAEHRVVIVENSGWLAASGKGSSDGEDPNTEGETMDSGRFATLTETLKNLGDDVVFILVEEKIDKRSKLYKTLTSTGIVEEFTKQTEDSLVRWLINNARACNKEMSPGVANYLIEEAGTDMMLLEGEISKLAAYCLDRDKITVKDIDTVCTHQINNKIFDMVTAISFGRQKEALKLYDDLLTLRESPFHILALLTNQYSRMLAVKDGLSRGESAVTLAGKLDMRDWMVKKLAEPARRLSMEDIEAGLEGCASTDAAIKSGEVTDRLGVELLLVELSGKYIL